MAFQGGPKWFKGCPKEPKKTSKSVQGEKKSFKGHPKKATNNKKMLKKSYWKPLKSANQEGFQNNSQTNNRKRDLKNR